MSSRHELFTKIAREHLHIETLEQRHRDALDFHEVGVVGVQHALDAAYRAGQSDLAEVLAAAEALFAAEGSTDETPLAYRNRQKARNRLRRVVRQLRKQNMLPKP